MALTRSARLHLIDGVLAAVDGRKTGTPESESRINMILVGFDLNEVTTWDSSPENFIDGVRRRLQDAEESTLLEMADHLSVPVSRDGQPIDDSGIWTNGFIRVFLSHSAQHKGFVAQVAEHLHQHGLHGFVAHEDIAVTKIWQSEIERALQTSEVFVGLVHPEFINSPWTNQEIGWALGRGMPLFMIRLGKDPSGFPGTTQWESMEGKTPEAVAGRIAAWVNTLEGHSDTIGGRLIAHLSSARDYVSAGTAGDALNAFDALTPPQWIELDEAFIGNDQVHGGVLARRALSPLYARHDRCFPTRA